MLDLVTRLVDKSLVQVDHGDPDARYRMLESVRQFLQARLVESGDADAVRERHFSYFLGLAEQLAPRLALGDGPQCLARLEAEHDNLDAAMEWGDTARPKEEVLRFATALTLFWELRGHLGKGGRWFARVLRDEDAAPSVSRARALWGAAHVGLYGDDFATMQIRAPQALAMAEAVGDDWAAARALNTLGLAELLYDPEAGRARLERSIELGRAIGDDWAVADGWKMMTVSYYVEHDEAGAAGALEELRRVAEDLDSDFFRAWYFGEVGYFAARRGDYAAAHAAFDRSALCCRAVGDPSTGGFTETWSLDARAAAGDLEGAAAGLEAFLARANAAGSGLSIAEAVASLGDILLATGDADAACGLLEPVIETARAEAPPVWIGQLLRALGAAKRMTGDLEAAQVALDEAAEIGTMLGNDYLLALIEYELALVAQARDAAARAEDLLHSALGRQVRHDLKPGIPATLDALGALALDAESASEAVRCFAAADALRSAIGLATRPFDETERAPRIKLARDLLGEETFDQHWNEAANLPLGEMIEYVSRARRTQATVVGMGQPHPRGTTNRHPGRRRAHQPADRGTNVHRTWNRQSAPQPRLRQTRRRDTRRARRASDQARTRRNLTTARRRRITPGCAANPNPRLNLLASERLCPANCRAGLPRRRPVRPGGCWGSSPLLGAVELCGRLVWCAYAFSAYLYSNVTASAKTLPASFAPCGAGARDTITGDLGRSAAGLCAAVRGRSAPGWVVLVRQTRVGCLPCARGPLGETCEEGRCRGASSEVLNL